MCRTVVGDSTFSKYHCVEGALSEYVFRSRSRHMGQSRLSAGDSLLVSFNFENEGVMTRR